MEETKAITKELQELFTTVVRQADQYTQAFDHLETLIAEFGKLKEDLSAQGSRQASDLYDAIRRQEGDLKATLDELNDRINKAVEIYKTISELDRRIGKVQKLEKSLLDQVESIHKEKVQMVGSFESLYAKNNNEIAQRFESMRHSIRKSFENEGKKLELRNAMKMQGLESKIIVFDQKLEAQRDLITDQILRMEEKLEDPTKNKFLDDMLKRINKIHDELETLQIDVDNFNSFINNNSGRGGGSSMSQSISVDDALADLKSAVEDIEGRLDEENDKVTEFSKMMDSFDEKMDRFDKMKGKTESQAHLSMILSVVNLIILLIFIALAVL